MRNPDSPALPVIRRLAILLALLAPGIVIRPAAAQENGKPPPEPKKKEEPKEKGPGKPGTTKALSIDEEYVRDRLKDYLQPSKIEWLPDGRVKMLLHFGKQIPEHEEIFVPRVVSSVNSKFRWTVRGEYGRDDGESPDPVTPAPGGDEEKTGSGTSSTLYGAGLRFGMDGQALLNCWFTDDIEAEICFAQGIGHSDKQQFGFVFVNEQGRGVGSNFGSQPAMFRGSRLEKAQGTVEPVLVDQGMRFRLALKSGKLEVSRKKKSAKTWEYPQKSFASGRLGFVWGGGVACIVTRIEITGKVDAKKMAAILRKVPKR